MPGKTPPSTTAISVAPIAMMLLVVPFFVQWLAAVLRRDNNGMPGL